MYQPDETIRLEVRVENETVWLTQQQMAELFNATKQNISLHINNIYDEGELERIATVKDYLTVQKEGKRMVKRRVTLPARQLANHILYPRCSQGQKAGIALDRTNLLGYCPVDWRYSRSLLW